MGMTVLKAKNDAPVCLDRHSPEALQFALERMQRVSGQIERLRLFGNIQYLEDTANLRDQILPDPLLSSFW